MSLYSILSEYKFVISFYLIIFILIYINRKKFEFQSKFIALYRTKLGLKLMERIALSYPKAIKYIAYVGIAVGYIGMLVMSYIVVKGFFTLFISPNAPPVVTPIIPGVPIPGSPIFVPFWHGIIALFVVVIIHEFCHGIVARANGLSVKSSGFAMFAILPAAFVEPDEKELQKKDKKTQLSIFAAGPFSNILLGGLLFLIIYLVIPPIHDRIAEPSGFSFSQLVEGYPAIESGLETNVIYTKVNGKEALTNQKFIQELGEIKPNNTVTIGNEENTYLIKAAENPDNKSKGYLGVIITQRYKDEDKFYFKATEWAIELIVWLFVLTLGLGLANLLPLGPVDGGRMLLVALTHKFGEKRGKLLWAKISFLFIAIIIILVLVPIIKAII